MSENYFNDYNRNVNSRQRRERDNSHRQNIKTLSLLMSSDSDLQIYNRLKLLIHSNYDLTTKNRLVREYWDYYNSHAPYELNVTRSNQNFNNFKAYIRKLYNPNNYNLPLLSEYQKMVIIKIYKAYHNLEIFNDRHNIYFTILDNVNDSGQRIFITLCTPRDFQVNAHEDQNFTNADERARNLMYVMQEIINPNYDVDLNTCIYYYIKNQAAEEGYNADIKYLRQSKDINLNYIAVPSRSRLFIPKFNELLDLNWQNYEIKRAERRTNAYDYVFQFIGITVRFVFNTRRINQNNLRDLLTSDRRILSRYNISFRRMNRGNNVMEEI